jgi:hypothetical protein
MSVTLDVSRLSGWLNALAFWNMYCMLVTLDVFRLSGWLNAYASQNMRYMFVTLDVSHLDMSALKLFWPSKRELMSVTSETCQAEMGPYVAVAVAASLL